MNYSTSFISLFLGLLMGCAQQKTETTLLSPGTIYQAYYAALDTASTVDDFHQIHMKYGSAHVRLEVVGKAGGVEISSDAEKQKARTALTTAFTAIKEKFPRYAALNWASLKETVQENEAMIEVTSQDGTLQIAAILVKEGNAWKLEKNFLKHIVSPSSQAHSGDTT